MMVNSIRQGIVASLLGKGEAAVSGEEGEITGCTNPDVSQIREAMRGKAERDPRRERIGIRDQADRSDNAASRACRFEVSSEHHRRDRPYLAEPHNSYAK